MSTTIVTFKFSDYDAFKKCKEKLQYQLGGYGWDTDSDSSFFSDASTWYIKIMDNIKDAGVAGDICRAHGGKPY